MGLHSRRTARDAGGRGLDSGSRQLFSRIRGAKVNQLTVAVPLHSASGSGLATDLASETAEHARQATDDAAQIPVLVNRSGRC